MKKTLCALMIIFAMAVNAQAATQFDFLLSQVRTSTTSLAGGHVYFNSAGTTTPQTVWLDKDQVTPASNPYTLDANGTAQLYGNGFYRIVIYDAAGVKRFDRDNIFTGQSSGTGGGGGTSDYSALTNLPCIYVMPSGDTTGVTDYTNIQAAVTAATGTGRKIVLQTPGTRYNISQQIVLPATPITIEGEAYSSYNVTIHATAPMVSLFVMPESTTRNQIFRNLYLDCNGSQYGFLAGAIDGTTTTNTAAYMTWDHVLVKGSSIAAWQVGGWNNVWQSCEVINCTGNGIVLTGVQNNASRILDCDIEGCNGFGIIYYGGYHFQIQGGSIQGNKKGGIYVGSSYGLHISTYFEANGQTGYAMTTPARTIKSDILIGSFAQGTEAGVNSTSFSFGLNIEGCTFISTYVDQPVFMVGLCKSLRIVGNSGGYSVSKPLFAFELNGSYLGLLSLEIKQNANFKQAYSAQPVTGQSAALVIGAGNQSNTNRLSGWVIEDNPALPAGTTFNEFVARSNAFLFTPLDLLPLGIQSSNKGAIGRAAKSQRAYANAEGYELTCGNSTSTDVFGKSIQSSEYAPWAGKLVYYAGSFLGIDGTLPEGSLYVKITWNAWASSHAYAMVGERAYNGSNLYEVTAAGTSASSGGPTGTGTVITDGTVTWKYVAANVTPAFVQVDAGGSLSTSTWQARETHFVWPNPGATVLVGISLPFSGSAGLRAVGTRLVLAPVGRPYADYDFPALVWQATAAPVNGWWQPGDRVKNSAPATGQPKGWINTATTEGMAYKATRADATVYAVNDKVLWSTGTTVWECTTAGTATTGAPSISGIAVGGTVTDGTVTWTLRSLTAATFVSEGNL